MTVRVTALDLETGEEETTLVEDNYVLITSGSCEMTYVTASMTGRTETHVLTVKGVKRKQYERRN